MNIIDGPHFDNTRENTNETNNAHSQVLRKKLNQASYSMASSPQRELQQENEKYKLKRID